MVSKRQKAEMRDYIVDKLRGSADKVEPRQREIFRGSGIETSYILIGKDNRGIVLLVDRHYPNHALDEIHKGVKRQIPNVGVVLFKDGKTFFRTAMDPTEGSGIKDKRYKQKYG